MNAKLVANICLRRSRKLETQHSLFLLADTQIQVVHEALQIYQGLQEDRISVNRAFTLSSIGGLTSM